MAMKKKNRPSFFAVLVQGYINKLQVPPAFVRKCGFNWPENAQLRTSCGEIWDVKIEEFNEYKYFTVGWRKFVKDAELRREEFLVFWFNINSSIFDVSIFGIGGLERGISVQNNISITEDELDDDDDDDDALAPAGNGPRFDLLLKKHHISRLQLRKDFVVAAGLLGENAVILEYPPYKRRWTVTLHRYTNVKKFRIDMSRGWGGFRRANGLVCGKTYSFQYIKDKNVVEVKPFR
ncbi:hypothetical protein ACP275_08G044100 [Erythranthe tilingii]